MAEGNSPLFFLPSAVKTPLSLVHFARNLNPSTPFYSFEYGGMDGVQSPDTSLEETAAEFVSEISAMASRTTITLGGQCFGGIVAYEMARQLTDLDFDIDHLG